MSDKASGAHDKYIPLDEAVYLLNVRFERIAWFIATGRLASKRNPRDKNSKLVSLQDIDRLRNFPHLLAPWIIYALIDPRNDAVRYVGRTYEPQIRLREHLRNVDGAVGVKYCWIRELKEHGMLPRLEVLEGVDGFLEDAEARERVWIQNFINAGAELINIQYRDS